MKNEILLLRIRPGYSPFYKEDMDARRSVCLTINIGYQLSEETGGMKNLAIDFIKS